MTHRSMTILSVRDFRNNLAKYLNLIDQGERVFIHRNNRLYTLVPIEEEDLEITPALAQKIATAREELVEARTLGFDSASEAAAWMDSL